MTNFPQDFEQSANHLSAFKAVATQLLDLYEDTTFGMPQSDEVARLCQELETYAAKANFPAMAGTFKDLLAEIESPHAEQLASLASRIALKSDIPAAAQIVNKLHLADISAHVPNFGPELAPAKSLRDDVEGQLQRMLDSGLDSVPAIVLDSLHASGDLPDLPDNGRQMIADFLEKAVDNVVKSESVDPYTASRWLHRAFVITETSLLNGPYPEISEKLFDHLPYAQQVEVLDGKIDGGTFGRQPHEPVNSFLSRFGATVGDFLDADGETLKKAEIFLPKPEGFGGQMALGIK